MPDYLLPYEGQSSYKLYPWNLNIAIIRERQNIPLLLDQKRVYLRDKDLPASLVLALLSRNVFISLFWRASSSSRPSPALGQKHSQPERED